MTNVLVWLIAAVLAAAPSATLTGTWNMGLQGDHVIPTALVLKQDGKAVTGTIALPTRNARERQEVALTGEFDGSSLRLTGAVEGASETIQLEIAGTLKDDGTLEGTFVMHGHNLTWTAERLKERKPR